VPLRVCGAVLYVPTRVALAPRRGRMVSAAPSSLVPENHEAQLHVSGDVHEESAQSMSNSTYHMELLRPACKKNCTRFGFDEVLDSDVW
jgi:hypothetical protein